MALMNQKGEDWLTRGAEGRSSTHRDLKAKGRKGSSREGRDFSGTERGWESKSGGKMDALRGVSTETRFRPSRDGRREEIGKG